MSRNPFDEFDKYLGNFFTDSPYPPYDPYRRKKTTQNLIDDLKKALKDILNDKDAKTKMNKMKKTETLRANVKRGNKVFRITIENITPKPSEVPDEVEIEWNPKEPTGKFGPHEDLTE